MHSPVSDLRDEWSAFPCEAEVSTYETAGLIAGLAAKRDDLGTITLSSSRLWALRRLLKLWKFSCWESRLNIAACMLVPEAMKGRVRIVLPEEFYDEIMCFSLQKSAERPWDWTRGLWGSCGALYVPRSGYYLVIRTGRDDVAERMDLILRKARIVPGARVVHGVHELIVRDQQAIVTFLSKIGLTDISLSMEDKAILRAMRDQANRMRNCDTANIRKSLKAAEQQLELALRLQKNGMLATLPSHLNELVLARLARPEASLSEVGEALSPPVTKSTVKYRWKRLCEFVGETDGFE